MRKIVGICLVAGLFLAGCGDDEDTAPTGTTPTTERPAGSGRQTPSVP